MMMDTAAAVLMTTLQRVVWLKMAYGVELSDIDISQTVWYLLMVWYLLVILQYD